MTHALDEYVGILARGGVVACPTETLFGLMADALRPETVERIVKIKRRPVGEPIALIVPNEEAAIELSEDFPAAARSLAARFWPGPLTLVVQARPGLPQPLVQGGKVGLRVPGPSPALELVRAFGAPLTATSANRSGKPPARDAADVRQALGGEVDAIVPGHAPGGAPSTVVDVTVDPPRVLRPGAVTI